VAGLVRIFPTAHEREWALMADSWKVDGQGFFHLDEFAFIRVHERFRFLSNAAPAQCSGLCVPGALSVI
jgi:hypothetical protein